MDDGQEFFQIATLIVVVVIALVLMYYLLIFINPQIEINPFKPPTVIPAVVAGLSAVSSPTAAAAPSETLALAPTSAVTPLPTQTSTSPPVPTSTCTGTPGPSATLRQSTPTPTLRPPTATPRPPTSTPLPPTALPISSQYYYRPVLQGCVHSGGTYIKGTVWIGQTPQSDVRVRVSTGPEAGSVVAEAITAPQSDGTWTYTIVLKAIGSFGATPAAWYVWTADANGKPTSDPNFTVTTNNLNPSDPNACWFVTLDFAH